MILGLLKPTSGKVLINGINVGSSATVNCCVFLIIASCCSRFLFYDDLKDIYQEKDKYKWFMNVIDVNEYY